MHNILNNRKYKRKNINYLLSKSNGWVVEDNLLLHNSSIINTYLSVDIKPNVGKLEELEMKRSEVSSERSSNMCIPNVKK